MRYEEINIVLVPVIQQAIHDLYKCSIESDQIQIQNTRSEFEGDFTLVVFPLVKLLRKSPQQVAEAIGERLLEKSEYISQYNVVKGFLNLEIKKGYWLSGFYEAFVNPNYGILQTREKGQLMVEYSSPNTNKPLHLGHLRNNFLGYAVSQILSASGHEVIRTQIINDRGIHICKSMVAWLKTGQGETPDSTGLKGDKLVGKYYVEFERLYQNDIKILLSNGMDKAQAEQKAPIMLAAKEMLVKWEQKDPEVIKLWKTMNEWVYAGFDETYATMGVHFDQLYYESETYLKGRDEVLKGLKNGVFYQKEDGSVWVDLTDEGLDHKLLLRADGTSVYVTQDIGTAILRFSDNPNLTGLIYTVGNEQEYHFNVLFKILKKLGYPWADQLVHLSYGMVDLPSGKMKSREGTVVDADDLMMEMKETAGQITKELGKLDGMTTDEQNHLFHSIGQASLKYYLLKVDPKKRMLFDPVESIDFNGNTGPFIQYTYARIQSVLRKYGKAVEPLDHGVEMQAIEKDIIKTILDFPSVVQEASEQMSPALIANYSYLLVKSYNTFYQSLPILKVDDSSIQAFRIALSELTGRVVKISMGLLGIELPDKM